MAKLELELAQLRAENDMLKRLLAKHGITIPGTVAETNQIGYVHSDMTVTGTLSPEAKVRLSRKLFRGREDVYPVRWTSTQTGKAGYSPVCANEWRRGVCEKPRIKCSDCHHSLYLPMTDQVIFNHLKGEITAGIYPLLIEDRCHF